MLRLIRSRLGEFVGRIPLNGCFWGESEGARLAAGGASIPGYQDTGGEGEPSARDQELALWAVLYTDPWYELRLLEQRTPPADLPPDVTPPSARLRERVDAFQPSAELLRLAGELPLSRAFAEVRRSAAFDAATRTARDDQLDHVRAVARAVVSWASVSAAESGVPDLDGMTRDAITERLVGELDGHGRGVAEWVGRQLVGLATRVATRSLTRRRGSVTDSAAFLAGDILRYQARGGGVRNAIRRSIEATESDDVTVLAHSLGGVACVDLLACHDLPAVRGLITVGSQAPLLYELGALTSLTHPTELPASFPKWLNIFDRRDLLSYVGAELFPGRVTDVEVDNGQPFPVAHSAYWSNAATWSAIGDFVMTP